MCPTTRSFITRLLFTVCFSIAPARVSADDLIDITGLSVEELLQMRIDVASHFEESELETASTVEQVSKANWKQRGARTVADAIGDLPGTAVLPSINGGYTLAIRGYANPAYRGVNLRLDGVPLNEFITGGGAPQELLPYQLGTLSKIEMIRGPGSAIYGTDAFHGVLSMETFSAEKDVTEMDARLGDDLYRETALRMSKAVSDKIRFNGAVSYNGNEDLDQEYHYTDPDTGENKSAKRQNRFNSYMGVLKLESDAKENLVGKAGFYFYGHNAHNFTGQGRITSPNDQSVLRDRDFSGGDSGAVMATTTWTLKLAEALSLEASGYGWRKDFSRDFDLTRLRKVSTIFDTIEDRAGGTLLMKNTINELNTRVSFGYEYNYQETRETTASTVDEAGDVLSSVRDGADGRVRRVHSAVLDARTALLSDEFVTLVYGGRFDEYSDSDEHFSPRAGVIFRPDTDWSVKLLYGNAYRAVSSSEAGGTPFVGPASGKPEVIDTYEFTVMKEAERWKTYTTLFYSDWDDAILVTQNPAPPPPLARLNAGKNRARGVESGFGYRDDIIRADFSGSYVESEDRTNDRDYVAFPAWIFNVGTGVKIPEAHLDFYLQNRILAEAAEGAVSTNIPNPKDLKDYWRTDLTITWSPSDQPYDVYVNILNLFDRENFFPSAFSSEGGTPDIDLTALVGIEWHL